VYPKSTGILKNLTNYTALTSTFSMVKKLKKTKKAFDDSKVNRSPRNKYQLGSNEFAIHQQQVFIILLYARL